MIEFNKIQESSNSKEFEVIPKKGTYKSNLAVIRLSKQDDKFVDLGQEPKTQVSFVFDVIDKDGNNVSVPTKTFGFSFTYKSNLPKFWAPAVTMSNGNDMAKYFYGDKQDEANHVILRGYEVLVNVIQKDDKIFNEITEIIDTLN